MTARGSYTRLLYEPSLASFFTAARTSSAVAASKPVVGSSKSNTGGFETSAKAILVRFRSPPR